MDSDLALSSCFDKERLAALRTTLAEVSETLDELQIEQTRLQAELALFQNEYFQRVGRLYAELDEVLARLAERRAARSPEEDFLAAARRRRRRAERSSREYRSWQQANEKNPPPSPSPPSEPAKKLYRKIAAALHPDLAEDEKAREARTRLMADLNDAYARGDIGRMQAILETWEKSPEAVSDDDPEAEAIRLERTIGQLRERLRNLEAEIRQLKNSALYRLMSRSRDASRQGRDLLAELAEEIKRKTALAENELAEL